VVLRIESKALCILRSTLPLSYTLTPLNLLNTGCYLNKWITIKINLRKMSLRFFCSEWRKLLR
jgi:hypothetical protein